MKASIKIHVAKIRDTPTSKNVKIETEILNKSDSGGAAIPAADIGIPKMYIA